MGSNHNLPDINHPEHPSTTIQTSGNKPRTIHVAHRRSPSELTTLMRKYTAQQQQILQQQQQFTQQTSYAQPGYSFPGVSAMPPPANTPRHNRRTSGNVNHGEQEHFQTVRGHRRAQSSVAPGTQQNYNKQDTRQQALGHTRRHSLGVSEAKRAAAEAQAQRSGQPLKTESSPPSFKFPPDNDDDNYQVQGGHYRSKSNMSPQRSFQFPPRDSSQTLMPPPVNFGHERRQSGNYSFRTAPSDINGNWRKQQQPVPSQPSVSGFESPFTPGHRARSSYGGSVSSLAQFNQSQNGQQRKSLFAPYLPQSSLPELISEGRLVTGVLRVNKKNRSDAYVSTDGLLDADIFICGSKDRNRALEGDLVAVELLVVDEVWSSKREKEEKKRRKDNIVASTDITDDFHNDASTSYSSSASSGAPADSASTETPPSTQSSSGLSRGSGSLNRRGSLKQRPTQKKNDDVEVEGQSLLLVEEEEISDDCKPLYAGHVVAVVDRIPGQLFSGTLGLLRPSQAAKERDNKDKDDQKHSNNARPKIVWFKPTGKKVPLIAIPTEQVPKDFVQNHEKYADQVFIASIKRWPITSLHPFGTLVAQLGPMNDPEVEIDSILRDNNFLCDEYPEDEDKYVAELPDVTAALNDEHRRNFKDEYVIAFTQTGSFCDHALHVKVISETKIELGIHIVDVAHFIKQGSGLDKRSKKRSHSVFLPQKTVHLFPGKVNDQISFKENKSNLAISVVFEIDSTTFDIDDVWMGESVVTPKQKVDYSTMDEIINKTLSQTSEGINATSGYISTLALIAQGLRRRRLNNPELKIEPVLPLLDQLDDENVRLSLNIFDSYPSATVIDEIFHNVNAAVAQRIHAILGDRAFLRKYSIPTLTKFENYNRKAAHLGVSLDTTNAASFQNSLLRIEDPVKRSAIETILIKSMPRGKYVIAGKTDADSLNHYLFNLPVYTHFTAPLRRYSDIIVHRQLKAVLNDDTDDYKETLDSLKMNSDYCNFKKDCAKAAQEQAIHLLLCQTINEMSSESGQILTMGTVIQVYESSFDVLLPEFGIEKRVHGDQLPLQKAEFDKTTRVLELHWEPGVDSATYIPDDEKEPLSYRSSIKNKYRSPSSTAAKTQSKSALENGGLISAELAKKLEALNIRPPKVTVPTQKTAVERAAGAGSVKSAPETSPIGTLERNASDPQRSLSTATASLSTKNPVDQDPALAPYLSDCITRVENDSYIQEIRELKQVPILLRSEVGMALPCLTVRTLNPFSNVKRE
ncbi:hypothetical protein KL929_000940 [Ogataea haglerorum]|nr:hypothetical protein KL929_000940 [Ogataea haglerorum]